ncbi:MAG TPA: histidine kinase, partial [Oscillatoriales bacterium UBA8482]|nr:histidine kinase [Oscillatoriales bacterium UBA8482]
MNLDENSQFAGSTSADQIGQNLGADLVFVQNAAGQYLSFCWQPNDRYSLPVDRIIGSSIGDYFKPVILSPYQDRVNRVLTSLIPERFVYSFAYEDQYIPLELTMTPILVSHGKPDRVL